jgi:hypothetical protein
VIVDVLAESRQELIAAARDGNIQAAPAMEIFDDTEREFAASLFCDSKFFRKPCSTSESLRRSFTSLSLQRSVTGQRISLPSQKSRCVGHRQMALRR